MKILKYSPIIVLLASLFSLPVLAEDSIQSEPAFTQAELDQLLAPIALYPDVLLSQVLMAATYPLEVVEASRWSRAHPDLEGDEAVQAVQDEAWDVSVKALVGFPDLIQRMDENLGWTRRLGDAFLMQEELVLETTQELRERALAEGSLESLEHVTVERQTEQIIIEPADVKVVYVPYYSTRVVYGDWWWNDYPPYYWGPPAGSYSSIGFTWSRGFRVSTHFYYSTCDWPRRSIVIVNSHRGPNRFDFHRSQVLRRYDHYAHTWRHDPFHRKGVRYRYPGQWDRYHSDYRRDGTRVRIPHTDRDQRRDRLDRRPVQVDRRKRIDRYNRGDRRDSDNRYDRDRRNPDQHYERDRREYERQKPRVVRRPDDNRDRRPEARPDRLRIRPDVHPDRSRVRPERQVRPDRSQQRERPVVATRPKAKPPERRSAPPPEANVRTNDRSNRSFVQNTKKSRMQRNTSDRTRSLQRRTPWRKADP